MLLTSRLVTCNYIKEVQPQISAMTAVHGISHGRGPQKEHGAESDSSGIADAAGTEKTKILAPEAQSC